VVVLGTVKGDIHDLGKTLVAMMMEGAGFEVIDLGVNISTDKFIEAVTTHQPDILGMSALLTTTMPHMQRVIERLKAEKLRDDLVVLVGGAPLSSSFATEIEADAYCRDAVTAVQTARTLLDLNGQEG
jgi:5-methyltetrahydrofolate--homocysteine methyltransferase